MSVYLSQGISLAIASAYGSTKNLTALSNASEGVATLEASHGIVVGDIFEVVSGWDRLNNRIVRAKTVVTNDVTLEGIDTSSTTFYPAGSGTGTVREVTTFTTISQLTSLNADAPSTDFADITTLANQTRQRIPTLENAPNFNFEVLYDPAATWLSAVLAASDANSLVAIRMQLSTGAKIYANGYIKFSRFPRPQVGEALKASGTLSLVSTPTFYAS